MSKQPAYRPHKRTLPQRAARLNRRESSGQALVEYALITVLVIMAVIAAFELTGPVIGNIFSNTVRGLIGNDAATITPINATEFWNTVTAVAQFTPDDIVIPTNTMAPPTETDVPANTPTETPINTTPTATATYTATPGPTDTPEDQTFLAPVTFLINPEEEENWRMDTDSLFLGYDPWQAQWFSFSGGTNEATAAMGGSPDCTSTIPGNQQLDFNWGSNGPVQDNTWNCNVGSVSIGSVWRNQDFAARFTRTLRFENDTPVVLSANSDDGIRVIIDGTQVAAISEWWDQGFGTPATTNFVFTGGGDHTVVVEYYENGGSAGIQFLITNGLNDDVGTCNWAISNEQAYSPSTAWSDSPGSYYYDNSRCHLALRGAINLSTLEDGESPQMSFWERWQLNNTDGAWLQIREYDPDNYTLGAIQTPWYSTRLHVGYSQQISWERDTLDLSSFSGTPFNQNFVAQGPLETVDWTDMTVEFRFVLRTDSSSTWDGWWIDDISVEGYSLNVYTVGFQDNMDAGPDNWLPGGTWAITNERVRSGDGAWSDSPYSSYVHNTNSSLQLNGIIDLTGPESYDPQLIFYHSWYLNDGGDRIYAEVSADQQTWVSLTPLNIDSALVEGWNQNTGYAREEISLLPYDGTTFYLRFRIETNGSGSLRDGWYIDDFILQNRPTGNMTYPFFDGMELGPDNWLPEGSWSISSEQAYEGSVAWSDSPGSNYTHGSNSSLVSALPFLVTPAMSTNLELSFYANWYVGRWDNIYVEASTNGGSSWTTLWSYIYQETYSPPPGAPGTNLVEFNEQRGWERVSINMNDYISDAVPFLLRFRLDATTDGTTRDGVWIDNIRLAEYVEDVHTISDTESFTDDMESTTNWYAGDTWAVSTEQSHSGSRAWSDSPGGSYRDDAWSVLELAQPLDLTGVTTQDFPILTFWDRFRLQAYDYARVQVSVFNGPNWDDWGNWQQVYQQYYTDTVSWDRRRVDLRPYAGEKIRLRFVLDSMQHSNTSDGWWIDDVTVGLYDPRIVPIASGFFDGAESTSNWITEGDWGLGDIFRGTGSGPAVLGPGSWTAKFYDLDQYTCSDMATRGDRAIRQLTFWCGGNVSYTLQQQVQLEDVDYNCVEPNGMYPLAAPNASCLPLSWKASGVNNTNAYAVQFVRQINLEADGTYTFSVRHDDGVRLYVDGTRVINSWGDTSAVTHTTGAIFLTAGPHELEVRYYENSGDSVLQLDIAAQSFSFTDSPDGDYQHLSNASLIFNGVIDTSGSTQPTLSWWQTYDLDWTDCAIAEISVPRYGTGSGITTTQISGSLVGGAVFGNFAGTSYWTGQSFMMTSTGYLNTISVAMGQSINIPAGTVATWELRANAGGVPGAVLESGTFTPVAATASVIQASQSTQLTANTLYWVLLRPTTPLAFNQYWTWSFTNNVYPNGQLDFTTNGGSTWTASAYDQVMSVTVGQNLGQQSDFEDWIEVYRVCGNASNMTWQQQIIPLRQPIESHLGMASGTFDFNSTWLEFRFRLDARVSSNTDPGWWIDDVVVSQ